MKKDENGIIIFNEKEVNIICWILAFLWSMAWGLGIGFLAKSLIGGIVMFIIWIVLCIAIAFEGAEGPF